MIQERQRKRDRLPLGYQIVDDGSEIGPDDLIWNKATQKWENVSGLIFWFIEQKIAKGGTFARLKEEA